MKWILVFLGGGLGSLLRFGISAVFFERHLIFPWPTIVANFLASILIGFIWLAGWKFQQTNLWFLLAVGFCGGLSTFSAFSLEIFQMIRQGSYLMAATYVTLSIFLSVVILFIIAKLFFSVES